jgi:two-component system CheB/CheR fusion protein
MIEEAASTGLRVIKENVPIEVGSGSEAINLVIEPILPPAGKASHYIVIFQRAGTSKPRADLPAAQDRSALEGEMSSIRSRLQAALDEAEQANEDLVSANEEFQSLNEELQSSNEELETSKEEMQSINEELHTVNNELNEKNVRLYRLNSDLQNLIESTDIAILFLDDGLAVRTFTPACTKLFHLRDNDYGRPVTEIASRLSYEAVESDVRQALETLSVVEREVHSQTTDATFLMRIRPYRTLSRIVDGVVITFVDITDRKRHEEARGRLAAIVESSQDAIIGHALDGTITSWNRGAEAILKFTAEETIGKPLSILARQGEMDAMPSILDRIKSGEAVKNFEIARSGKDGKCIEMSLAVSPVRNMEGKIIAASTVARDITERAQAERQRAMLMDELDHRVKNTLATVNSIAAQTAKNATTVEEFSEAFEDRLCSLSQTHNLLTEGHWEGASWRKIIATELSPYGHDGDNPRFSLDGDDIRLRPRQALTMGMAVHELATNAAKYGAFSTDTGRVDVSWVVENHAGEDYLRLRWLENGGPPVKPPAGRGFGTRLLESGLPRETGAQVQLEFAPKGIRCTITMPTKGGAK